MARLRPLKLILRRALGAGLAASLAGCSSMPNLDAWNPFVEHEKPLPGPRSPVFPQGVPGIDYSAAPDQPSNNNAVLDRLPPNPQQQNQQPQGQTN